MVWSKSFTSIPMVDVGPLRERTSAANVAEEKRRVAQQLHVACKKVGFFYVKNHGVPEHVHQNVLTQAREWFNLPAKVKEHSLLTPETSYRGYQPMGVNVTKFKGRYYRDGQEAFDLYKEESNEAAKRQGRPFSPVHGCNQWPVQHAPFNDTLQEYVSEMFELGRAIVSGISLGLGLEEDHIHKAVATCYGDDPYWYTRILHYPPLAEAIKWDSSETRTGPEEEEADMPVRISCGEHTDYGLLTIVNQDPHISALQVKNLHGDWISADPIPGAFVCNIGDMMKILTNGAYTPTVHRVVNADPRLSRVSIPFFFEPPYESEVAPIKDLCSESNPSKYSTIRYGNHLEKKVLQNFVFKQ